MYNRRTLLKTVGASALGVVVAGTASADDELFQKAWDRTGGDWDRNDYHTITCNFIRDDRANFGHDAIDAVEELFEEYVSFTTLDVDGYIIDVYDYDGLVPMEWDDEDDVWRCNFHAGTDYIESSIDDFETSGIFYWYTDSSEDSQPQGRAGDYHNASPFESNLHREPYMRSQAFYDDTARDQYKTTAHEAGHAVIHHQARDDDSDHDLATAINDIYGNWKYRTIMSQGCDECAHEQLTEGTCSVSIDKDEVPPREIELSSCHVGAARERLEDNKDRF